MSKFKIKTPLINKINETEIEIKAESFGKDSEFHVVDQGKYDPKSKPDKSFTIPLNSYELLLLRKVAKKFERSQRYLARKLLTQALEEQELKLQTNNAIERN